MRCVVRVGMRFIWYAVVVHYSVACQLDGASYALRVLFEKMFTDAIMALPDCRARFCSGSGAGRGAANGRGALHQAAQDDYGTDGRVPYNFNFIDKRTEERFCCTQLAWRVYERAGIDIDSNHPAYQEFIATTAGSLGPLFALAAVAPDEIYLDADLNQIDVVQVP